ncbi:hypothetical protein [Methanobrevibacter oralis]|uniref:Uncharacterized protein n=1 Tax=Methanobrevibacter oralis TaxID=66851 RepID=A0A162FHS2_METOA|nr:hypothetical protein [Methanobrevibacter oralis]KZX13245.1 hypothetical protein MBORA_07950 [Methanobrevibacter oralis]
MNYKGKKILKDVFEITSKERISFREIFGLTFVFKTSKISYKNSHFNGEVKAIGIIYKENEDYFFAPFEKENNLDLIAKEYVEKYLKK